MLGRVSALRLPSRPSLRPIREAILDLAFPAACVGCDAELATRDPAVGGALVCSNCLDELAAFAGAVCARCGAKMPDVSRDRSRCAVCRDEKLWFDETIALGEYEGLLRAWLLQMKRSRGDVVSLTIGRLLWQLHGPRLTAAQPDVVVPVPMHWRRRWLHGTNSAAVLDEVLADKLRVPLATSMLRRLRHTSPQFSLPPSQRRANVRGAFAVRTGYNLEQANVLLVDDILTTGSACSEAARALKRAGAARVIVAVAARTMTN
jgi:ComF family protein